MTGIRKKTSVSEEKDETVVATSVVETEVFQEPVEQPKEQATEPLIYCGPSLPTGLLSRFVVYRGGLPKHLNDHFEKCPALKQLFVPVENLSDCMKAINTTGSAESIWFKEIEVHFAGGVKQ